MAAFYAQALEGQTGVVTIEATTDAISSNRYGRLTRVNQHLARH